MIDITTLRKAFSLMCAAKNMSDVYDANRQICKYVHSTSRGHEAIQLATAFQLKPYDYVSPYYRDESLLLGLGFEPYQLMLQLLAKRDDIFSGGRSYYTHPNYKGADKPTIIHQSSATGMQAIPTTGLAQGIQFMEDLHLSAYAHQKPVVICSLGDASLTEGEVSEAFQFAVLKKLPIIYLVQDNEWGISVRREEARAMDACEYALGFPGMQYAKINGSDFEECHQAVAHAIAHARERKGPYLLQAKVPLLGHHTSGVRKEFYRTKDDLMQQAAYDPFVHLRNRLLELNISEEVLRNEEAAIAKDIAIAFENAVAALDPDPLTVDKYVFIETPVTEEKGERQPLHANKIPMVDAALFAIREIMEDYPEALLYGQDVGRRLGGVFREAATLAEKFGDKRVFNTAIQEAYLIGSTVGMCAVGVKPIVEIQFSDYIYPGLNQLVTEISKSCYLSCGKFPIQTLIRIPTGAYIGGGPYHSGSVETTLLSIKGIKVVYPSNTADMKGLIKAAFMDPNPVVMLEHKGLYWSKVPGTEEAKCEEPSRDYIVPLGKGRVALYANADKVKEGESCCIITYGMGIYWAKSAAYAFEGQIEIIDLRTLFPLDEDLIYAAVMRHGKCLVLTEEQQNNSFAEALAARISKHCFYYLDAPVEVLGAVNLPAVPLNEELEKAMLPNADKVKERLMSLLSN